MLFINGKVDVPLESSRDLCKARVEILRISRRGGNNEGRSRFIDKNGVYLVNDRVVELSLAETIFRVLQVVAEIVEPEFIVGAVGDVRAIGLAARAWP